MTNKVAVVTGANKGIGYAIVKGLCEKFNGKVYLTARNENLGNEAIGKLKELGLCAEFHQLDVNDQDSINAFKNYIKDKEGGIDVLVNNAGMAFKKSATEPTGVQAEVTINTNYYGTLRVCDALFPLLRPHARVVHLSSSLGHLSHVPSPELRSKFVDPNLTVPQLNQLMNQYISDAKNNVHEKNGWGNSSYSISKVGVSALTFIQQRQFDKDNKQISVNSVHPGHVNTDMSSRTGPLTIEEGAASSIFLALGKHEIKGQYVWKDNTVLDWNADKTPERY